MNWSDYVRTLDHSTHVRLILAIGAGLHAARLAAEQVGDNDDVVAIAGNLDTEIGWLTDARRALDRAHQ
jgi:hypothetical protein